MIKDQESLKSDTAELETQNKKDLPRQAPSQGALKDRTQELQAQAANLSPPAATSLGDAAGQMQNAQNSLAEGKNNELAQQAALDALQRADQQLGRDIARLIQVAALDQKLKRLGHNAAREFNERLIEKMRTVGQ